MSDNSELNGTEPIVPAATPVVDAPKASSGDFLATTAGKAVLVAGAVVLLLVIAGVVGWFVLGPASLGTGTPSAAASVMPSPAPSAVTSSSVATLPVADVTSRDVFTPRNPFTVIQASVIATHTSSSDDGTATLDPDDVVLTDIITEDSVRKAVIAYGGHTYTLAAGDLVPGTTDWKVLSVKTNSVTMLFGDVSVTLTPGQGTAK